MQLLIFVIPCYRSPEKEARILELVQGRPHFMQGELLLDAVGIGCPERDVALLSRIQFALTVAYHFIFVPLSVGLGLILAIFATKYHRSRSEADGNAMRFWVRIFTATFAIGVATGITMVQYRLTRQHAFETLRGAARTQRRKLAAVASETVQACEQLFL